MWIPSGIAIGWICCGYLDAFIMFLASTWMECSNMALGLIDTWID